MLTSQIHGSVGSLEWGVAARPYPGETSSGDLWLVKDFPDGVLVAVVDVLGHGEEAAAAARKAVAVLKQYAHEPLSSLVQECHRALLGTRGAVMSLASFSLSASTVTWLGIGNVEGVLLFADPDARPRRTSLVTQGGIVGGDLPKGRPWVVPLARGDTLMFATDGVRSGFAEGLTSRDSAQQLADRILAKHAKGTDDALVLVVRYLGSG